MVNRLGQVRDVNISISRNVTSEMNFLIDTTGQADLVSKDRLLESDDDDVVFGDISLDPSKLSKKKSKKRKQKPATRVSKSSSTDIDLDEFERDMGWTSKRRPQLKKVLNVAKMTNAVDPVEKALEKSAIKPGFEQLETVPTYDLSAKRLRALRQKERSKTKGKKWFNLPAPEMTEEIKHDLEIIQMRSVLDPKHFYKKNDLKVLPKYFQIGKVVDSPINYYSGRLTKKERKRTIVDELMADAEFSRYNKRKYKEIVDEQRKSQYKAHKHAKKLKGKKK